jgi:pyruvate dehydrogenase E1 component alpha subunit
LSLGIQINGMNVLAVKQGMAMVREHCSSGKGPIYVELDTYRYHGHSMSDPGTTYRTRDEVGGVRSTRDPIEYVKKLLTDHNMCTADELKNIEKDVRNYVQDELAKAKAGHFPPDEWLYQDVYSTEDGKNAPPLTMRTPDYKKSLGQIV